MRRLAACPNFLHGNLRGEEHSRSPVLPRSVESELCIYECTTKSELCIHEYGEMSFFLFLHV